MYMGNSSHVSFFVLFCFFFLRAVLGGQLGGGQGECLKYPIAFSFWARGWVGRGEIGSGIWDLESPNCFFLFRVKSKGIREWDMGFGIT